MNSKLLLYIATPALLLTACSSLDCSINSQVNCAYGIQDTEGKDSTLALHDTLSISIKRYANATDSVATKDTILNRLTSSKAFTLPMSESGDNDVLYLTLKHDSTATYHDTVYITKTNEPTFESVDCTPRFNHTITAIRTTHHFIDSLLINKAQVTNDASTKNIYLRLRKNK